MKMLYYFGIACLGFVDVSMIKSDDDTGSMVGALGGVFAKSKISNEFYFIAPLSLQYIGIVHSFQSLEDLIGALPVIGQPTYWVNYSESKHSKLVVGELELEPLGEEELKMIEARCLGGSRSFPRSDGEIHPALPIPPSKK